MKWIPLPGTEQSQADISKKKKRRAAVLPLQTQNKNDVMKHFTKKGD